MSAKPYYIYSSHYITPSKTTTKTMTITREQSSAMRGIAILSIVLHNFTHWLRPMVKENEYTFSQHNADRIMYELAHPASDLYAHVLSFFGHYGVPVFLFLSAYGLVVKYERSGNGGSPWRFITSHYRKLFLMMLTGYSAFVLTDYMTPHPRHYEFWNVIGQLGMFSNLYADPDGSIWPGPYWYFGLMVQVYVVYRLVLHDGRGSLCGRLSQRWQTAVAVLLASVTLFAQLLFDPVGEGLNWYRYNVFGALPVFVFGMLLARRGGSMALPTYAYAAGAVVFSLLCVVGSTSFGSWLFVPFMVCLAAYCTVKCLPMFALQALSWTGSVSAAMFVCHPITRKIIIPIAHRGDIATGVTLYLVTTIMLSILFNALISGLTKKKS